MPVTKGTEKSNGLLVFRFKPNVFKAVDTMDATKGSNNCVNGRYGVNGSDSKVIFKRIIRQVDHMGRKEGLTMQLIVVLR
eukprot:12450983-Ditylum_brightwellii.AAC.1